MTEIAGRVLPVVDDPDTAGFWEAAARRELVVRRCPACESVVHLPRQTCPCGSDATEWVAVSGRGTIFSWTVVEHQVHPGHPTPYTVVLVALDDEPTVRLLGSLPGRVRLSPGQPVVVDYETVDGVVIPQWRLADAHRPATP